MNFNNKVAAISGAGSGIGQALAINLAQQGCHLAISDINQDGLNDTLGKLKDYPVNVSSHLLNVADEHAVFDWADLVAAEHGQVNLIFNNAGVALSGTVAGLSIDDFKWILDINFWGVLYGTKAFLPHLEASGEGHIINISSVFGLTSQPFMSGYNATKFAVRGFSESLRQELELSDSNVSVTCIHPGGIKTNIAKSSRISDSVEKTTGISRENSINDFEQFLKTTADKAAKVILKGVQKNKRRVLIGADAKFLDYLARLFPTGYQKLLTAMVKRNSKSSVQFG